MHPGSAWGPFVPVSVSFVEGLALCCRTFPECLVIHHQPRDPVSLANLLKFGDCAGTTKQEILCSPTLPEPELTPLRFLDPETGTTNSRQIKNLHMIRGCKKTLGAVSLEPRAQQAQLNQRNTAQRTHVNKWTDQQRQKCGGAVSWWYDDTRGPRACVATVI